MAGVVEGYLGIDIGTQGLSVLLTDTNLKVLATGEGWYGFANGLEEGCYEQVVQDWEHALETAMQAIHRRQVDDADADAVTTIKVLAIGIAGQMHGEVLADATGKALSPVRLWCDARNEAEGLELTQLLQSKVPKRATAARFLWTTRNRPKLAQQVRHLTTPAGWIAHKLTGEWNLGIGDAAGMFPIDSVTLDFNPDLLEKFDQLVNNPSIPSLASILPAVKKAGEDAGRLHESGAALLGLHDDGVGIPVAAAEGDQVAALAGSLIGRPGMVSCCFGTSVCANSVGDNRAFVGVSPSVDHFRSADGKPIHMVWLRNGTTFLNTLVESYGTFASVMPQLLQAPPDCEGLLALPFMDDEPGLRVSEGGSALIVGWSPDNAKPGNVAKAALLATVFNLRLGCEVLDQQGYPRREIILSGGLTKTPECGQIVSDIFNTPVQLLESAEEGCSWGAAIMAKFRHVKGNDWLAFLDSIAVSANTGGQQQQQRQRFEPNVNAVSEYEKVFQRYKALIELQPQMTKIMNESK